MSSSAIRLPSADAFIKNCHLHDSEFLPSDCTFVRCLDYFRKKDFLESVWPEGGKLLGDSVTKSCGIVNLSKWVAPVENSQVALAFDTALIKTTSNSTAATNSSDSSITRRVFSGTMEISPQQAGMSAATKTKLALSIAGVAILLLIFAGLVAYNVYLFFKCRRAKAEREKTISSLDSKENKGTALNFSQYSLNEKRIPFGAPSSSIASTPKRELKSQPQTSVAHMALSPSKLRTEAGSSSTGPGVRPKRMS